MLCEMCGSDGILTRTIIEGAAMNVCESCTQYGKVLTPKKMEAPKKQKHAQKTPESIEKVTSDIGTILKTLREKKNMTQKEFAIILAAKESLIHKIETGNAIPDIPTAKKWEKITGKRLVIETENNGETFTKSDTKKITGLTIGDMMKS